MRSIRITGSSARAAAYDCFAVVGCLALALLSWAHPALARPLDHISICSIQGNSHTSPFAGRSVRTQGVVYADLDSTARRGFFIQSGDCEAGSGASSGLFVYLGAKTDLVSAGDLVEVVGTVQEYYGMTEMAAAPADVRRISPGSPLPIARELNPPFEAEAARAYFESLEGMHVKMEEAAVVGPTDGDDQTWVVQAGLGIRRVFQDDPAGTGEVVCVDDGGLFEVTPEARTGDRLRDLRGALEFTGGVFCLQLTGLPELYPGGPPPVPLPGPADPPPQAFSFSLATFNLADLFDTYDDPSRQDSLLSPAEYQRRLQKRALAIHDALGEPDILAVQEAENLAVLQHLVARREIAADYGILWEDGPDERGIDIALLYRTDRVALLGYQVRQGCTALADGLGPDGNRDVDNPVNSVTCDMDHDGQPDGNRLFSRPPLLAHLQIGAGSSEPVELWLIANHFKSKLEDSASIQTTLPRRLQQAEFVAALVDEIRLAYPGANLVVLGDLNDYPGAPPLAALGATGLANAWQQVGRPERYSYLYRGVSQVLDYVLFALRPPLAPWSVTAAHINADYPFVFAGVNEAVQRCSDHDPLLVRFSRFDHLVYLPVAVEK